MPDKEKCRRAGVMGCEARGVKPWTHAEDDHLRAYASEKDTSALAADLGRTLNAIHNRLAKLRLTQGRGKPWTATDDSWLRDLYGKLSAREIGEALGRSMHAVRVRCHRLGLPLIRPDWSEEDEVRLRQMYESCVPMEEMELALGRSRMAIHEHASVLGVKRSKEWLARMSRASSLAQSEASREYARASGWPESLYPQQVQVLNFLASRKGLHSKRDIQEGIEWKGRKERGLAFCDLRKMGLVASIRRGKRAFFFLGPVALKILKERVHESEGRDEAKPTG